MICSSSYANCILGDPEADSQDGMKIHGRNRRAHQFQKTPEQFEIPASDWPISEEHLYWDTFVPSYAELFSPLIGVFSRLFGESLDLEFQKKNTAESTLTLKFRLWADRKYREFGTFHRGQEPITRSIQLPCVRATAFSQVGLFLDQ